MVEKQPNPTRDEQFPKHDEQSFIRGVIERNSDYKLPPVAEKEPQDVATPAVKPTDVKEETVSKEAPAEQPKGQDSPAPEETELNDDDLLYLESKGILGDSEELADKTPEQVKEYVSALKAQEKPKETEQPKGQDPILISQEMGDAIGGIAKSFVGKSAQDLLKAMADQQAYITKLEQSIKQPNLETKKNDTTAVKDIADLSDFGELSADEQKEKITEIVKNVTGEKGQAEIEKIVQKVVKEAIPEEVKQVAMERAISQFHQEIQKGLPEGYKSDETILRFKAEKNLTPAEVEFYKAYPNRLIKDVQDFAETDHLRKTVNEITKNKDREIRLQSYARFRSAMTRANGTPSGSTDINVTSRTAPKTNIDWTVEKIRARHKKD